MNDQQTQDPNIGRTLAGTYLITERIGAGGMGVLYKATNQQLDQPVALKMMHGSGDSESAKRFLREAKALATLVHPNIVAVKSLHVEESGEIFLVMEYLQGQDLSACLKQNGPLSLDQFKSIFAQVCSGLSFAHSKNIIHRDLKPSNIMLLSREDGGFTAKILDFGLAKCTEQTKSQSLTATGAIFGSPNYMSPEQCSGQNADRRSDIYSLACVMHECLTGAVPFAANSAVQIIFRHMHDALPPLEIESLGALSSVLQKATAIDPLERFDSVEDFWAAVTANKAVTLNQPLPKKTPARKIFVIAMLALLAMGVVAFSLKLSTETPSISAQVEKALHLGAHPNWYRMSAELEELSKDNTMSASLAESVRDHCYVWAGDKKLRDDERQLLGNLMIDYGILRIKKLRETDPNRSTASETLGLVQLMEKLSRYDRETEVLNQELHWDQGSTRDDLRFQLHLRRADWLQHDRPLDAVPDYELALENCRSAMSAHPSKGLMAIIAKTTEDLCAIYNRSGQYKKTIKVVNAYYQTTGQYIAGDIAHAQDGGPDSTAQMEISLGNAYKGLGDAANAHDHFAHAKDIALSALEEPDQLTSAQISRLNQQLQTATDYVRKF
jgi:serine/threonine-protein kinase